jgi:uncharacterized protein (TIGR02996 family)
MARKSASPPSPAPRPEVLAFLRAAREQSDDDTPRLVLADWLEEHGSEADVGRAALIRLQCERARLDADGPRAAELREQENTLWDRYEDAWLGPVLAVCFGGKHYRSFDARGLLHLSVDGGKLLTRAGLGLAATEWFAWAEGLRFAKLAPSACQKLVASPILDGLTALSLSRTNVRGVDLIDLVQSPRLALMRRLSFDQLSAPVEEIASSPHLARLRELSLSNANVHDLEVYNLALSPHLNELRRLDLRNNNLGPDAARALADCEGLPALTELELGGDNTLGPEGARALASSTHRTGLTHLGLWSTELGDAGAGALTAYPNLSRLEVLDLQGNEIGDRGAIALAGAAHLATLRVLDLHNNRIALAGAEALAASPHLGGLTRLKFTRNRGGRAAAAVLRERFGDRVEV